jgi:putative endonuclease
MNFLSENNPNQSSKTSQIGKSGEQIAADYIEAAGYRIVVCNFTAPIGRSRNGATVKGEIDIVAVDGETLCFIEVKTRTSDDFADPIVNVDRRKQAVISRTAGVYLTLFGLGEIKYRYDVVTLVTGNNESPKIRLYKGFWSDRKRQIKRIDNSDIF